MYRILYISTAVGTLSDAAIQDILRTSQRNNAAVGVTGLLVVGGKRFMQVLEGPQAAVDTTYERIRIDPRHRAAVTLRCDEVETRMFPNWAMAYQSGGAASAKGNLQQAVSTLCAPITDPNLRAYFTGFSELHAAA